MTVIRGKISDHMIRIPAASADKGIYAWAISRKLCYFGINSMSLVPAWTTSHHERGEAYRPGESVYVIEDFGQPQATPPPPCDVNGKVEVPLAALPCQTPRDNGVSHD